MISERIINVFDGVKSRTQFLISLEQSIAYADHQLTILLLEINQLKDIELAVSDREFNSIYLDYIKRMQLSLPDDSYIGHMGKYGFAVLILNSKESADIVQSLLEVLNRPYYLGKKAINLESSIGLAISNEFIEDAYDFLRSAEIALKSSDPMQRVNLGKYNKSILTQMHNEQQIERDLRQCIKDEEDRLLAGEPCQQFEVFYQPQVSAKNYKVTGVEALLRWKHPVKGYISPEIFVPIADRIEVLDALTYWLIQHSFSDVMQIAKQSANQLLKLSINISPSQLIKATALIEQLKKAMKTTAMPASNVVLEMTEIVPLTEFTKELELLKSIGCQLALDDFGTGYSSMHTLRTMPLDYAKLDKSFVMHLYSEQCKNTSADESMIRTFQIMCNSLGLKSVIEGVESAKQRDFLRSMGCNQLQGFLFSKPVPFNELQLRISQRKKIA